jgi:hypothetical protein
LGTGRSATRSVDAVLAGGAAVATRSAVVRVALGVDAPFVATGCARVAAGEQAAGRARTAEVGAAVRALTTHGTGRVFVPKDLTIRERYRRSRAASVRLAQSAAAPCARRAFKAIIAGGTREGAPQSTGPARGVARDAKVPTAPRAGSRAVAVRASDPPEGGAASCAEARAAALVGRAVVQPPGRADAGRMEPRTGRSATRSADTALAGGAAVAASATVVVVIGRIDAYPITFHLSRLGTIAAANSIDTALAGRANVPTSTAVVRIGGGVDAYSVTSHLSRLGTVAAARAASADTALVGGTDVAASAAVSRVGGGVDAHPVAHALRKWATARLVFRAAVTDLLLTTFVQASGYRDTSVVEPCEIHAQL